FLFAIIYIYSSGLSMLAIDLFCCFCFFFSSRRRHTRCYRDWSSDVCSSDLYGILAEMLKECFGLTVSRSELHLCKSLMSWYYRTGFRRLLRRILSSPVLHIDETEVNLRTGKGYVWVFTTLEEVMFLYRPTREGDFLKKL